MFMLRRTNHQIMRKIRLIRVDDVKAIKGRARGIGGCLAAG
jgi:hypothetical protein